MTYTILILEGFDNLFNVLFFQVGILFTLSVTKHHQISLTVCLQFPAVLTHTQSSLPTPGRSHPHPAVLTHTRPFSPTPDRHQLSPAVIPHSPPSPAVPLIFVDTFPAVIPITCGVCPTPAVLTFTLPSSDAPYSPPHNSGRPPISPAVCINSHCLMCLTIPRKA